MHRRDMSDPPLPPGHWWSRALLFAIVLATAGCGVRDDANPAPWKDDAPREAASEAPQPTPDASGVVPGCPITLAEARAAVPSLVHGPVVGIPFENVTGSCSFASDRVQIGRPPPGVSVLVFDAAGAGIAMWDDARRDPGFPNVTIVAGLGDDAFVAGEPPFTDLFAVQGQVALHVRTDLDDGLPADQLAALARAALNRLAP